MYGIDVRVPANVDGATAEIGAICQGGVRRLTKDWAIFTSVMILV
jgi:hypothetical protein